MIGIPGRFVQLRQTTVERGGIGHVLHSTFDKLDQACKRRDVQIRIVTFACIQVGIWFRRLDQRGFLIVVDSQLVVVIGGVRDFENAGQPQVNIVRNLRKLTREFFSKQADFIRRQLLVPEQESVGFEIFDAL